jgi:hypothetical protein
MKVRADKTGEGAKSSVAKSSTTNTEKETQRQKDNAMTTEVS